MDMLKKIATTATAAGVLGLAGMASVYAGGGGAPDQIRVEARMSMAVELAAMGAFG